MSDLSWELLHASLLITIFLKLQRSEAAVSTQVGKEGIGELMKEALNFSQALNIRVDTVPCEIAMTHQV